MLNRNNILAFILGVVTTLICVFLVMYLFHKPIKGYNYSDAREREVFIEILKRYDVLYTYKIDPFKEHWIIPQVRDVSYLIPVEKEFEIYRKNNQNKKGK